MDVDTDDKVYVFSRRNHPVTVFDPDGNLIRSWGEDGVFTNPNALTVTAANTVWCVDNVDHSIRQFTPGGELISTPNEIVVSDGYGNARVHRYTPQGELMYSFGEPGTDPSAFNLVHDMDIDEKGNIYIADRENRRIQVFD